VFLRRVSPQTLPLLFAESGVVFKDKLVTLVWSSGKSILFRRCSIAKVIALVQLPHCSDANPYSLHCKANTAPMQIQNPQIRSLSGYIFSLLLDLLAGYSYRPGRTVITYLLMIIGFAAAYHFFGGLSLDPLDAFVYSLTSFHGRGFFPGLQNNHSLHDPLVMLAALEAVIGLVIEASFIATFTQRYFGR
jgi:hypothetical protein